MIEKLQTGMSLCFERRRSNYSYGQMISGGWFVGFEGLQWNHIHPPPECEGVHGENPSRQRQHLDLKRWQTGCFCPSIDGL